MAAEIAGLIHLREAEGKRCVLGLATGSTPTGVYKELIGLHRRGAFVHNVVTFNLDEYWPMNPNELQSYRRFMNEHLFDHVDIHPQNVHIPDGTLPLEEVAAFCDEYERKIAEAGGIDFQIAGHRPHRPYRIQRARFAARQPDATDHAGPRDADGRRQRFLRRMESFRAKRSPWASKRSCRRGASC